MPQVSKKLINAAREFRTKKQLGQVFLVDEEVLDAIAAELRCQSQDLLIEIGPGIGFLTERLVKLNCPVVAVDLDRQCIEELQTRSWPNLDLKHGDFLDFDLDRLRFGFKRSDANLDELEQSKLPALVVVGNVPYQITGLLLSHILGEIGKPSKWGKRIKCIVLTVQREVAQRMVATAGSENYSQLSLLTSYFSQASILCTVPRASFYPAPRVESAVVKLIPHQESPVECQDHEYLRKVIVASFKQRRKMLRNSLHSLVSDQAKVENAFKNLKLDPQMRAESLSLKGFAALTDELLRG